MPLPSTTLVEKKPTFCVSSGFLLVHSVLRFWGSDSPVREELSTCGAPRVIQQRSRRAEG